MAMLMFKGLNPVARNLPTRHRRRALLGSKPGKVLGNESIVRGGQDEVMLILGSATKDRLPFVEPNGGRLDFFHRSSLI